MCDTIKRIFFLWGRTFRDILPYHFKKTRWKAERDEGMGIIPWNEIFLNPELLKCEFTKNGLRQEKSNILYIIYNILYIQYISLGIMDIYPS